MKYKKDQQKTPLAEALIQYEKDNVVSFDVPGHKKNSQFGELTEFFGEKILIRDPNSMKQLDNLGHPIGVILETEALIADAYGADNATFLINGTSMGIQAMIMSVCKPGDKIMMPRNVHKSAINALILSAAIPVYVQPEISINLGVSMGMNLEGIKNAYEEHPDVKAILVINPTYYGYVSDLKAIIEFAHERGIAVLVDEAHGAHFAFHEELPECGAALGADLTATSLHKTGGSLTQSSIILHNDGLIEFEHVREVLNLTQSTSASYILMASVDLTRKYLATKGRARISELLEYVQEFRVKMKKLHEYYCYGTDLENGEGAFKFDALKLGISVRKLGITGFEAYDILRDEYGIQMELGDMYNILGIVSVGDTKENFDKLYAALDDMRKKYKKKALKRKNFLFHMPTVIVSPRLAYYSSKRIIPLDEAVGEISGESIMAYPPGIPIVVPGEKITKEIVEYIRKIIASDCTVLGLSDLEGETIKVLGNEILR